MISKWEAYCRGQHLVIKSNELMDLSTIMCFAFVCTDEKQKEKKRPVNAQFFKLVQLQDLNVSHFHWLLFAYIEAGDCNNGCLCGN